MPIAIDSLAVALVELQIKFGGYKEHHFSHPSESSGMNT